MSQAVGNHALSYARLWHHVDLRGRTLGRVASRIATVLLGKHKPHFDSAADMGDYIVATNCRHIHVSGQKRFQKLYRSHSGYPGGFKEVPFERMMERTPEEILRKAVSGMLPKNRLRERRLARLLIFPEAEHPHAANIVKRYDVGGRASGAAVQPQSLKVPEAASASA